MLKPLYRGIAMPTGTSTRMHSPSTCTTTARLFGPPLDRCENPSCQCRCQGPPRTDRYMDDVRALGTHTPQAGNRHQPFAPPLCSFPAAGFYLHIRRCSAVLSVGRRGRYRSTLHDLRLPQASGSFVCSSRPILDFGCSAHLTSFLVTATKAVRDRASNLVPPSPLRYKIVVITCACVMPPPTWYVLGLSLPFIHVPISRNLRSSPNARVLQP